MGSEIHVITTLVSAMIGDRHMKLFFSQTIGQIFGDKQDWTCTRNQPKISHSVHCKIWTGRNCIYMMKKENVSIKVILNH